MMLQCPDALLQEYFAIFEQVATFDSQLLIVKGWGVTFGLATLALAFQKRSAGLFLIAALSAVSFWILEAQMKGFQMRYYPRMRHIEAVCSRLANAANEPPSPMIDWSWVLAHRQLSVGAVVPDTTRVPERERNIGYRNRLWSTHVMLPHVLTVMAGIGLALATPVRRRRDSRKDSQSVSRESDGEEEPVLVAGTPD